VFSPICLINDKRRSAVWRTDDIATPEFLSWLMNKASAVVQRFVLPGVSQQIYRRSQWYMIPLTGGEGKET